MICEDCIHWSVCKYGENRSNGGYCTGEKCKQFKSEARCIELPAKVGDTVYCDICNEGKGYLDECKIINIEFDKDFEEPLFAAVCYDRAEYKTYWASDFGKTIFHEPQFVSKKPKKH